MAERNLEIFGALGMVALPERAIAIGAIAQVQPHSTGAVTITFVSGESVLLQEAEADDFFTQINNLVRQMQYAASAAQSPRRIITH